MRILLITLSIIGLILTVIPSVLVFTQSMTMETHKDLMTAGMVLWFVTAVFWIKEQDV